MPAPATNTSLFLQTMLYLMNQTGTPEIDAPYNYDMLQNGIEFTEEKCYGMYGCFGLSPPWTSQYRPVSLFPEEIEQIQPQYPYYTRENPDDPRYFNLDDFDVVVTTGIDPKQPIFLIVHGYMEGGDTNPWIHNMARELLKLENCTVIVVDWHNGSGPSYTQSVANIRLVGAMTAHLLGEISDHTGDLGMEHVHCIGHSLGSHLCGYVGYTLQNDFNLTMGRITGLDPAEPYFANTSPPVRLDRSAAYYVDIIHTDARDFLKGNLGLTDVIGHVDFYPNGGSDQPGCKKSLRKYVDDEGGSLMEGLKKYFGCNHVRSHQIFVESIHSRCSFMTVACSSYEDFQKGKCFSCGRRGEKCLTFGYHSKKHYDRLIESRALHPLTNKTQYFLTGDRKPFCRGHYKVTIKISESQESRVHGGEIGKLVLIMHTTSDGLGRKTSPAELKTDYHEPGKTYTEVVAAEEIEHLKAIEVDWQHETSFFNPLTWRIMNPKIYIEKVTVHAFEINERLTVCPKSSEPLAHGYPELMIPAYC